MKSAISDEKKARAKSEISDERSTRVPISDLNIKTSGFSVSLARMVWPNQWQESSTRRAYMWPTSQSTAASAGSIARARKRATGAATRCGEIFWEGCHAQVRTVVIAVLVMCYSDARLLRLVRLLQPLRCFYIDTQSPGYCVECCHVAIICFVKLKAYSQCRDSVAHEFQA